MIETTIVSLLAIATALGFMLVRRPFVDAMTEARLTEIKGIKAELNRLAYQGRIERDSAFYEHFTELARGITALPARLTPPVLLILYFVGRRAQGKPGLSSYAGREDAPDGPPRSKEAYAELQGRYRAHAHLVRRLNWLVVDVLSYRSLVFWFSLRAMMLFFGVATVTFWLGEQFQQIVRAATPPKQAPT